MNMEENLNYEFANDIEEELSKNPKYIKANKEFHEFVYEKFPEEKAEQLDDLLEVLMGTVGNVYLTKGIKLGAKLVTTLLFG